MTDLSLLPPSAVVDGADIHIGGCSLTKLAAEFGTPAFIIDELALRGRARAFTGGLRARHPSSRVCFATKSFPSASMISVLASEGLGMDVVGAGELYIALAAGADPGGIERGAEVREIAFERRAIGDRHRSDARRAPERLRPGHARHLLPKLGIVGEVE